MCWLRNAGRADGSGTDALARDDPRAANAGDGGSVAGPFDVLTDARGVDACRGRDVLADRHGRRVRSDDDALDLRFRARCDQAGEADDADELEPARHGRNLQGQPADVQLHRATPIDRRLGETGSSPTGASEYAWVAYEEGRSQSILKAFPSRSRSGRAGSWLGRHSSTADGRRRRNVDGCNETGASQHSCRCRSALAPQLTCGHPNAPSIPCDASNAGRHAVAAMPFTWAWRVGSATSSGPCGGAHPASL